MAVSVVLALLAGPASALCVLRDATHKHRGSLDFIHVGKAGGTSIVAWLTQHHVPFQEIHLRQPALHADPCRRYVVWVRDPLERFRSAFNYERAVVSTNTTGMHVNESRATWCTLGRKNWRVAVEPGANHCGACTLGPDCLAPNKIARKVLYGHAYESHYDDMLLYFRDANHLGESLSSPVPTIAALAHKLMRSNIEHIHKGLGYYLHNGAFARTHPHLFVGRVERMDEDLRRLAKLLGLPTKDGIGANERRNPQQGARPFSPLARANLCREYNQSDFAALRELVRLRMLDARQYDLTCGGVLT